MRTLQRKRLPGDPSHLSDLHSAVKQLMAAHRFFHQLLGLGRAVGLDDVMDVPVVTLSHGRQRAVELGLALMAEPRVLLLDEPLAGVGHAEIAATMDLIERVREQRTVLLVEHNMDVVMKLSDEIVVMMGGEVLMRGTPAEVRADPRVQRAYLGEDEGREAAHA